MDEVKLLPCPFCGSPAHLIEGHRDHWRAQCSKCGANIGDFFASRIREKDQRDAAAAWNTRPTLVTGQLEEGLGGISGSREPDPSFTDSSPAGFTRARPVRVTPTLNLNPPNDP